MGQRTGSSKSLLINDFLHEQLISVLITWTSKLAEALLLLTFWPMFQAAWQAEAVAWQAVCAGLAPAITPYLGALWESWAPCVPHVAFVVNKIDGAYINIISAMERETPGLDFVLFKWYSVQVSSAGFRIIPLSLFSNFPHLCLPTHRGSKEMGENGQSPRRKGARAVR